MKKVLTGLLAYIGAFFFAGFVISLEGFVIRMVLGCYKIEPSKSCDLYSTQAVQLLNFIVLVAVTWFVGRKWYIDMEPLRRGKH